MKLQAAGGQAVSSQTDAAVAPMMSQRTQNIGIQKISTRAPLAEYDCGISWQERDEPFEHIRLRRLAKG